MKYNKSEIMMNAWNLVKNHGIDLSTALRSAWALAKAMNEAESYLGSYCGHAKVIVNDWVKGNHNRTYISVRHYTNAWNRKGETSLGYIDNLTGKRINA